MPMRPHTDAPHVRNVVVRKSHVIRVSYSARRRTEADESKAIVAGKARKTDETDEMSTESKS